MDSTFSEYDNAVIGRIQSVDPVNFYGARAGGPNEKKALAIIKYAIEDLMGWSVDKTINEFDEDVMEVMKLDKLMHYIDFPIEVDTGDINYILSRLYPNKVNISAENLIEEAYLRVLNADDEDAEGSARQFPREYFTGSVGFKRFCYCVKYLIDNFMVMESVEDIYKFFESPKGKRFLYDKRLKVPADQFSINMLDVIHYITSNDPDSELYYIYFKYLNQIADQS